MPINELLIREFKREMDANQKTLQRVPKKNGIGSLTRSLVRWVGWPDTLPACPVS